MPNIPQYGKNENNDQHVKSCLESYLQIFSGQKSGNKSLKMVQDKENCNTSLIRIQAAWTEGSFLGLGGLVRAFLSFDYTEQKKAPPNRCGSEAMLRL